MKKVALPLGIAVLAAGTLLIGGARPASAFSFTASGPATFALTGTGFFLSGPVAGGGPTSISLSGSGEKSLGGGLYTFSTLLLNGTGIESGSSSVLIASNFLEVGSLGSFSSLVGPETGDSFNLIYKDPGDGKAGVGLPPAVPEASSFMSFGALLALGGLAVIRRRRTA